MQLTDRSFNILIIAHIFCKCKIVFHVFFICTEFPSGSTRLFQQSEDKLNILIKASESHANAIDMRDSECTIDTDSDTDSNTDITEETSSSDMSSGDESSEAKFESHEKG